MSFSRRIAVSSLVLGVMFSGAALRAQEGADEATDPAAPAEQEPATKGKLPFALYVAASAGMVTADTIDTSIRTLVTHHATTFLDLEDAQLSRLGVGWKLPNGKGDFRVNVQNFKENGYLLHGQGLEAAVLPDPMGIDEPSVTENLLWWDVNVVDGAMTTTYSPPTWNSSLDTNLDGLVQANEVFYDPADRLVATRSIADDLENRTQAIDLLYGREFGRRLISSRWWTGMRYFTYEGNVPATAWLSTFKDGSAFTDGNFLRPLNFTQESRGFGPTGSLEIDFNFFSERLSLYLQGNVAFTVLSIDTDSGEFVTIVRSNTNPPLQITFPGRLQDSRNKSTWQNAVEVGARLNLKNGIGLELSYSVTGYLDVILAPTEIRIPINAQEGPQGTSALYNTQDLVFDGWRAGFSFQF
jgi:hypothetical protein